MYNEIPLTHDKTRYTLSLMPYRKFPPDKGNFYHIYNRSVGQQTIFTCYRDYERALETLNFYSFDKPGIRFSHFYRLNPKEKDNFLNKLEREHTRIMDIIAFCFMPTHIHFAFKEIRDDGITTFMRKFQDSYAKYFNTKYERVGALFQSMFKAERVLDDKNLVYVVNYIHFNPLKAGIVKTLKDLENYQGCSWTDYIGRRKLNFLNKSHILKQFKNRNDFATSSYSPNYNI